MKGWSKLRYEQHLSRFPPEERGERQRQATIRYRQAHAERLAQVRAIGNILVRAAEPLRRPSATPGRSTYLYISQAIGVDAEHDPLTQRGRGGAQ